MDDCISCVRGPDQRFGILNTFRRTQTIAYVAETSFLFFIFLIPHFLRFMEKCMPHAHSFPGFKMCISNSQIKHNLLFVHPTPLKYRLQITQNICAAETRNCSITHRWNLRVLVGPCVWFQGHLLCRTNWMHDSVRGTSQGGCEQKDFRQICSKQLKANDTKSEGLKNHKLKMPCVFPKTSNQMPI